MQILRTILTILFVIDCIALTVVVLMQEGKSQFVYLRLKKQHIKRVTRTDVEEYAEEEIASSFIMPNEK